MGVSEDAFERLRRVAFEGEYVERMAGLGARLQLSPGVIKTLVRLARHDGVSMGEMARGIGVDPSYITALVDDLDTRGLARREPSADDRRVKIIVLTDAGRALACEIDEVLSVPPSAFSAPVGSGTAAIAGPARQGVAGVGSPSGRGRSVRRRGERSRFVVAGVRGAGGASDSVAGVVARDEFFGGRRAVQNASGEPWRR